MWYCIKKGAFQPLKVIADLKFQSLNVNAIPISKGYRSKPPGPFPVLNKGVA
jgi:hypothetical protein